MWADVSLIKKVKITFIRYRNLIIELIKNIISFSLLIIVQQLIALPIIARFYDINYFGQIVLAFGISNILISVFGFSIGNARLLDEKCYNIQYIKLLMLSNILILMISFTIYNLLFSLDLLNALIFSIICMLGSIRLFIVSEYRIQNDHNWILKQNVFYFLGLILGVILFLNLKNWLIIFLLAEMFSLLVTYFVSLRGKFFTSFVDRRKLNLNNTYQMMFNNGLTYSLSQYDKFVIYPMLGPSNVSLYYSTSVSARVGGLILNPLSNYILGKLATVKKDKNKILKNSVMSSLFFTSIYFLITFITTPILVKVLYPNFLSQVISLIFPISLGAALMAGINVLKPLIMKFFSVNYYNKLFIYYGISLVFLSIILALKYGLVGVAYSKVLSSALLYFYILTKIKLYNYSKMG